jgi:hypothetical protein
MDRDLVPDPAQHAMAAARERVIDRLDHAGIRRVIGALLVDEWLRSTQMLSDFQAAPDFWELAYRFATDEYRRRAGVQLTPLGPRSGR